MDALWRYGDAGVSTFVTPIPIDLYHLRSLELPNTSHTVTDT